MKIFINASKIIFICLIITFIFPLSSAFGAFENLDISCPGDAYRCGVVSIGGVGSSTDAKCTIVGTANKGGQICNTNDDINAIYDSDDDILFNKQQGFLPTSYNGDPTSNTALFNNSPVDLYFNKVDDNGSATVGTAYYGYYGCPCGVNDISKPGCGGAFGSAGVVSGIANPGDQINLTVINACKPGLDTSSNTVGSWGGGAAYAYLEATSCNNATYYNWEVDQGYFPESYRNRNYIPTARGVCTLDTSTSNVSTPHLSATWSDGSTSKTVNLSSGSTSDTESFSWLNSGTGTLNVTGCPAATSGGSINTPPTCSGSSGSSAVTVLGVTAPTNVQVTVNSNGGNQPLTLIVNPASSQPPQPASCGTAAKDYLSTDTAYSGAFCSSGTSSPASPTFPSAGSYNTWSCAGAQCIARRAATPPTPDPIIVPTASLSPSGTTTYHSGDTVYYAWNSTNATSWSSTYSISGASCPAAGYSGQWIANTASSSGSSVSGKITDSQIGCTYTIVYTATKANSNNTSISGTATITMKVVAGTSTGSDGTWSCVNGGASCSATNGGSCPGSAPTNCGSTTNNGSWSCQNGVAYCAAAQTGGSCTGTAPTNCGSTPVNGTWSCVNGAASCSATNGGSCPGSAPTNCGGTCSSDSDCSQGKVCGFDGSSNTNVCTPPPDYAGAYNMTAPDTSTCGALSLRWTDNTYSSNYNNGWPPIIRDTISRSSTSNVYGGGNMSGTSYSGNNVVNGSYTFTDTDVTPGTPYYYWVTTNVYAVDSSGHEINSGHPVGFGRSQWNTGPVTPVECTTPPPSSLPIVNVTASKATLYQRKDTSTINWSASGATACVGTILPTNYKNKTGATVQITNPFVAPLATAGSISVTPPVTTTYTLTCTNAAGTAVGSTQVKAIYPDESEQ